MAVMLSDVDSLVSHFAEKIELLKLGISVKNLDSSSSGTILQELEHGITDLKEDLKVIKVTIQDITLALEKSSNMLIRLKQTKKIVNHVFDNLPRNLPIKDNRHSKPSKEKDSNESCDEEKEFVKPHSPVLKQQKATSNVKSNKRIPSINPLTVAEFDSVPKYMRGRLVCGSVNHVVNEFNVAISLKYKILRTPKSQLTTGNLKQFRAYKSQESSNTRGIFFCTSDDLCNLSKLKMEKSTFNILTILRHLSRIREVRGPGNLIRYAIL